MGSPDSLLNPKGRPFQKSNKCTIRSPLTLMVVTCAIVWFFHGAFVSFFDLSIVIDGKRGIGNGGVGVQKDELVTVLDFNNRTIVASAVSKKIQLNEISQSKISRYNFTNWIEQQNDISFEYLLGNIGDSNLNNDLIEAHGVKEGALVASLSKSHPDYFYQWSRDGAISINTLINVLDASSKVNITLLGTVLKYCNNVYELQRVDNLSGKFDDNQGLLGLGEPKFKVNNEPFPDVWGRPQNDGPSIRVIAMMNFLKHLKNKDMQLADVVHKYKTEYGADSLSDFHFGTEEELFEKVVYYDLKYVVHNWFRETYDLWEEIKGVHFFNILCHLKALKLGANYLKKGTTTDFSSKNYQDLITQMDAAIVNINNYLLHEGGFLNPNTNFVIETPQILGQRSGLDIGSIIGSTLTHDDLDDTEDYGEKAVPFNVDDPAILNVLYEMSKRMKILYPINHDRANLNTGVSLGRYPEDVYNGYDVSEANPWFLATAYAAELMYKFVFAHYHERKDLVIQVDDDNWNYIFWNFIFEGLSSVKNKKVAIPYNSPAFNQTMNSLLKYGDSFLDVIRIHVTDQGEMSEQFNKYTGYVEGAYNLSWSHSSFLNAIYWRSKVSKFVAH